MQTTPSYLQRPDWRMAWRGFWRGFWLTFLGGLVILTAKGAQPDVNEQHFAALGIARDHLFGFVEWEIGAVADKAANGLISPHRYMTPDEQTQYVREYLGLVEEIHRLESMVAAIYIDPAFDNPDTASAD